MINGLLYFFCSLNFVTRSMILLECDLTFKCIIKVRFNYRINRPCCIYDCLFTYKNEHH